MIGAEKEWWLTSGEVKSRLTQLGDLLNTLQGHACGRGVAAKYPALCDRIVAERDAFWAWRKTIEGVSWNASIADELGARTRRANALRVELEKAGAKQLPAPMIEYAQTGTQDMFAGVSGLAMLAIAVWAISQMGRR